MNQHVKPVAVILSGKNAAARYIERKYGDR